MIDFIAHDFWSAVWLALLVGAGLIVLRRGSSAARRILHCFIASWLMIRLTVTFARDSDLAWIAADAVTCMALVLYGRSKTAYAVAVLFALILALDNIAALGIAGFSQLAAASDLLGFIGLIIMATAGAGSVDGGKRTLARNMGSGMGELARVSGGNNSGRCGAARHVPGWRSISPSSGCSGEDLASNQKVVR